jgi:TetR/AcrR family transcriptional repressor of nem operon
MRKNSFRMMDNRRNAMVFRSQLKQASQYRILDAASRRLRREGLRGAAIATVMKEAGLTHGAFYSHFGNKDELAAAAFRHALADNRPRWMGRTRDASWAERLSRLARRYLTQSHRDTPDAGCALAAVASEVARSDAGFRRTYEQELRKSLEAICEANESSTGSVRMNDAIAFMALCIGGISLARAVEDKALSERILEACRAAAGRIPPDRGAP